MKKAVSVILALCIFALILAVPGFASGEVYVAAGNTVLPLTDAMPIKSSGVWYMDYQNFTKGGLNVSASYNSADGTLVLYTWDTTLVFDMKTATAHTKEENVPYKAVIFPSGGTVYVPVQFTAQKLGLRYVYFSDLPLIRVSKNGDIPTDMFEYIAKKAIPGVLEAYNSGKKTAQSGNAQTQTPQNKDTKNEVTTPAAKTEDEDREIIKNIYLTFNITNGKNLGAILDQLSKYGYKATFFVQGSAVKSCEEQLRRAVVSGHSIGTLSENGASDFAASPDSLASALARANEMLFETAKTKTRLLRVPGGSKTLSREARSKIIALGYRIWDETVLPTGKNGTAIFNSAENALYENSGSAVITLSEDSSSLKALTKLLSLFSHESCSLHTISLTDTPVNKISEKR